ncbi:MAG: sodium:proton antiporter NhaD [Pseudomonadales bacterium]
MNAKIWSSLQRLPWAWSSILATLIPSTSLAAGLEISPIELTHHWLGYLCLGIFTGAYVLVTLEEKIHLRKSKPVLLSAGLIWVLIAVFYQSHGDPELVHEAINRAFLEYAELFFFLLVGMTYINAMLERGVFDALRDFLISKNFDYKALFWLTGVLAFLISPVADNLTTALILCAVVLAVGVDNPRFISLGCINIVVAANAGGAFSPFGDITTLMVWQHGDIEFSKFFSLLAPSVVNFVLPALLMQIALPKGSPPIPSSKEVCLRRGALPIVFLFLCTIVTAVISQSLLGIPPVFGMMLGLAYLKIYGFFLRRNISPLHQDFTVIHSEDRDEDDFDVFDSIAHAEWDTLFFFYGVVMSVAGLGFLGYLQLVSGTLYTELGPTSANVLVGLLSAVVDNIPVMYAVLTMQPVMNEAQWLLVVLTAGVGGSLLSIGSAAGVALMGQARGHYTFLSHLKWSPVIALGYFASIGTHIFLNF